MSKFKFVERDVEEIEHLPPEPGESDVIMLEIAYQLKRIADKLEEGKKPG